MPLTTVELVTVGPRVEAPPGMVYSTQPQVAEANDSHEYFIKGPDQNVVIAELLGCLLAEESGLQVPAVAAARHGAAIFAGSRRVADALRNIMPVLRRPEVAVNFDELFDTVVVDAWLVNTDRNMGNCIASKGQAGSIRLVMIDFEKSAALRGPLPLMQCAGYGRAAT